MGDLPTIRALPGALLAWLLGELDGMMLSWPAAWLAAAVGDEHPLAEAAGFLVAGTDVEARRGLAEREQMLQRGREAVPEAWSGAWSALSDGAARELLAVTEGHLFAHRQREFQAEADRLAVGYEGQGERGQALEELERRREREEARHTSAAAALAGWRRLRFIRMDGIDRARAPGIWPGVLERGSTCLLYGHPGSGKSTLAGHLVAQIANQEGGRWPDGTAAVPAGVLWCSGPAEDRPRDLAERLHRLGCDLEMIYLVTTNEVLESGMGGEDIPQLRASAVRWRGEIGLVVFDSLAAIAAGVDLNDAAGTREFMSGVAAVAIELDAAVLVVHHSRKSGAGAAHQSAASGSVQVIGAVRAALEVRHEEEGQRSVSLVKANLRGDGEGRPFVIRFGEDGLDEVSWLEQWSAEFVERETKEAGTSPAAQRFAKAEREVWRKWQPKDQISVESWDAFCDDRKVNAANLRKRVGLVSLHDENDKRLVTAYLVPARASEE